MTKIVIPDAAVGGHQATTDWDKLMDPARNALEALIAKGDEMADRIEALTEQLAAARKDAEEAEAYAGELEGRIEELEAKLEKVVTAYRIEAMRRDGYTHDAFDRHIAELTGGKDD